MAVEFKYLFSPIDVGPMKLRNRIVSTPHATCYGQNHMYDERDIYYQAEKAKGGCALLCSGAQTVDPDQVPVIAPVWVCNVDDGIIPWYKRISDAVHEYGGKYVVQLSNFGGNRSSRLQPHAPPLRAASPIPSDMYKETPQEIDREGIENQVKLFGKAAARVKTGNCDGVIVQCGHGMFLMGFLSPRFNIRTDEFGGSVENRIKPILMVLSEIRKNIGRELALGVRISGDEFLEGGLTIDDAKVIARLLDKSGLIDWIDVSQGNDGNWLTKGIHYASMYIPLGAFVPLAAAIREVVKVPVVAVGRITDPVQAEKILADGHADLVGMTRALIADPHMPNKAKAGQLEDIRYCVGAAEACIARVYDEATMECVQNPIIGREKEWAELKPAAVKKKVMVIGGGPAGLEAARIAALRGHSVSLYEKTGELGGQVLIAAKAPTRQEIIGVVRWLIYQVQKLGIKVRLNTEVTPEIVAQEKPDAVVVATGSNPPQISIPGATEKNLVNERSVLLSKATVGQRVVVLDGVGNTPSTSVAEFLADQGKQVFILAKGYEVGDNIDCITKPLVYRSLFDRGVTMMPFTWIREISGKDVITYNTFNYQESKLENIDTVVTAMPAIANDKLYQALKGKVKELYAIGDCAAPRRIESAIYDGSKIGREI
jgi:mycofactocin system FadH/OYE family oxidoreductase 2